MKVAWAIRANGKDVTDSFKPYLLSISVRDESKDESDSLTIILDNSRTALVPPTQGDELEVLLGYESNLVSVGNYTVDSATFSGPPDNMTIKCKAAKFVNSSLNALHQSFLARKTRSWEPSTVQAICKKIAAEHGVELVSDASTFYMPTPHLDQTEESDTGFIYRVITPMGLIVKLANNRLVISRRSSGVTYNLKTGEPIKEVILNRNEVSSYSGEWTERAVFDKAVAYWHDPSTGLTRYEEAGSGNRIFRFKSQAPDQTTAQMWVKSILKQSQGEGGKMSMTIPGRPDIISEQLVTLEGFPYPLSVSASKSAIVKKWVLKSVEHTMTPGGYTTSITGEPFVQQ